MGEPVLADAALYDPTLYCFAIVMQDIGGTKKYYDLQLLQMAYEKQTSIFGCDSWGVFSDGEADLAPGVPVTKVDDADGDFHFTKREETGTWLNTGLHYQAWKAIQAEGKYATANWVVKIDADAVMMTSRLKYWLSDKYVPAEGIYLENCQYVKYGFFGSLEIFSKAAFETLLSSMARCSGRLFPSSSPPVRIPLRRLLPPSTGRCSEFWNGLHDSHELFFATLMCREVEMDERASSREA